MSAGDDSNNRLTAMSIADIRAYVTSELSRLKDDVSDLYDKITALKDASAADRMQVIAQLNREFQNFNNRLNDFTVIIQKVIGDSEYADAKFAGDLKNILLEVDNRMLRCRQDGHGAVTTSDMAALEQRMDVLAASIKRLETSITSLTKANTATKTKVQGLTWKLGLIIAGLVWLADKFGPDLLKSGFSSLLTQSGQAPPAVPNVDAKQQPPPLDTLSRGHTVVNGK